MTADTTRDRAALFSRASDALRWKAGVESSNGNTGLADQLVQDALEIDQLYDLEHAYAMNGSRATPEPRRDEDDQHLGSWARVDLGPALRGELAKITPRILKREDGAPLVYDGQVNWLWGSDGTGKTYVALLAAYQELEAGGTVEWINFEDPDERMTVDRLLDLGVDPAIVDARFHYRGPVDPFDDDVLSELEYRIRADGVTLVVIDSLGEAFGLEGIDENADIDAGEWLRRVARRLVDTGVAVLIIDHITKSGDNPLHPSGTKRKRASITGAGYLVEAPVPLTRERGGRLRLICGKDRHGHYGRGEEVAAIEFTRYPDDGLTVHIRKPLASEAAPDADQRIRLIARHAVRIAEEADRPLSLNELTERIDVRCRATLKRAGVEYAVAVGALRTEAGGRNAVMHAYVHDIDQEEAQ